MIRRPLDAIEWDDIEDLARQGIPESTTLEFKAEPIAETLEVARDVSAMANAGGGDLLLGVPEVNGVAQPPRPFPNGEKEGNRVVQIVSAGVSPPLAAIASKHLSSPARTGDVVIVRVPRSRYPSMVHLQNKTEFWVRRDRQRVPMSHAEIVSRIRSALQETREREDFLQQRIQRFTKQRRKGIGLLLAVTPHLSPDTLLAPVREPGIYTVIQDSRSDHISLVWGVQPQPSLHGIVGALPPNSNNYAFEIHHNGHVEIRHLETPLIFAGAPEARVLDQQILATTVVEIVRRARRIFRAAGIYEPYTTTVVLSAAVDTRMILGGGSAPGRTWDEADLVVQSIGYVDDLNDLSAKRLCDRIWQAYGHWDCSMFDEDTRYMLSPEA